MAKKQGSQLCNRQVCFFTGEALEPKQGEEVGQQAKCRKEETLNKPGPRRGGSTVRWDSENWQTLN